MASNFFLYALFFSSLCFNMSVLHAVTITVRNNCGSTIWPATQTPVGVEHASTSGFELAPQAEAEIEVPPNWTAGRIWARTNCSDNGGKLTCTVGECGNGVACNGNGGNPPVSLAEFTLNGASNLDFYDISLVDGFNLPVKVTPSDGNCKISSCLVDINDGCPVELAVPGGCQSACLKFGDQRFCCSGAFAKPDTCPPNEYSRIFKAKCPDAYSYAYDDGSSTFTCPAGGNYVVEFCPS